MLAACGSGTVRSHRASAGPTVASIRAVTPVRPGVVDLEVSSPAVGRTAVRIILPRDYGGRPAARWSVLYLLHGCCDSYLSWTRSTDIVPDPIEESIYAENLAFTARLRQLSIPATVDLYDNGTHSWPYWQRELHKAWPVIARALGIS
jgi:hypothetical protein